LHWYSFNTIIADSASWEVIGRKARLAGNGPVLAKRCNATDERFPARPKGVTQMSQSCVAAFEKDKPFPASCALTWNIWVALNPQLSC
jgi:hypothetical protein